MTGLGAFNSGFEHCFQDTPVATAKKDGLCYVFGAVMCVPSHGCEAVSSDAQSQERAAFLSCMRGILSYIPGILWEIPEVKLLALRKAGMDVIHLIFGRHKNMVS